MTISPVTTASASTQGKVATARRPGRLRRMVMAATFLLLCTLIFGYSYITDTTRVRAMAELYLSSLAGGKVTVDRATLSIFEGLRLDGVRLYVNPQFADGPPTDPDSLLFSAQTFLIRYHPRSILTGRLEALQIVAQKPQVYLTENVDRGDWNYQRLRQVRPPMPSRPHPGRQPRLPEVLLRNARVQIAEIQQGRRRLVGYMTIDGRLSPGADPSIYHFGLQSRGASEGLGPMVSGSVMLERAQVQARLTNFNIGGDVRVMLPAIVRQWWNRHELAGNIDVDIRYAPGRARQPKDFDVTATLRSVTLQADPREWLGRDDLANVSQQRSTLLIADQLYAAAGFPQARRQQRLPARPPPHAGRRGSVSQSLLSAIELPSVTLRNVSGTLRFTPERIDVQQLNGEVEGNALNINGVISGYRPDAPATLLIASAPGALLRVPEVPRYIASLPREARELYDLFRPQGTCRIWVQVQRPAAGGKPVVVGRVDPVDGEFLFSRFRYPLRHVSGRLEFGPDASGRDFLNVHLRGRGPADGPNRDTLFTIESFGQHVGPLGTNQCGVNVRISGDQVRPDPLLRTALPREVVQALSIFDAPGTDALPRFAGNFVCDVVRPIGRNQRWSFDTDIQLSDAEGMLKPFKYPLQHVSGLLKVRTGYCDLVNVAMKRGDASMRINGRVIWDNARKEPAPGRDAERSHLKLVVKDLPIDDALLDALPQEQREWLSRVGAAGTLDVDGTIFETPAPSTSVTPVMGPFDYDLSLRLNQGTFWPTDTLFTVSNVSGTMRVRSGELEIVGLQGHRQGAELSLGGSVTWKNDKPLLDLRVAAQNLTLDEPLYSLLPSAARSAWEQVRPQGSLDAGFRYRGPPSGSVAFHSSNDESHFEATLEPRDLSVTLHAIPYRMEKVKGAIRVVPGQIALHDITARHGDGTLAISGTGTLGPASHWDLHVSGSDLIADEELRRALPSVLSGLADSLKLGGKIGFDFPKFAYRSPSRSSDTTSEPDIDFSGSLKLSDATLDAGVVIEHANGEMDLDASVRRGQLTELQGSLQLPTLLMAGRPTTDFAFDLRKPIDRPELQLNRIRGLVAGGSLGGSILVSYPEKGPSQYRLSLAVREADVQAMAWESDKDLDGKLTASLSLEGNWGEINAKRGRGDVIVVGREMYRIPLVLGLLQVTNLALPITTPFNEATARYSVDGQRVTFEQIRLRSDTMLMNGDGQLDFGSKKVDLTFTTDNPGGLKVPFLHELLQGARNEMLRIYVKGSVQEPKVSAGSMGTFWTTVDEVFKKDPNAAPKRK